MPEPVAAIFRQPFPEQLAAFRNRLQTLQPTTKWDDVWQQQHDSAFMVAGAMKADLLADLAAAVDRSIAEGTGLEAFRKDFRSIVEKHGWHGWTGEGTAGGEAWRTRTIYRTNVRTSFMAGRHAQLVKGNFKYWVYRHGGSLEPRLHHLAWDGLILPADHPFWATHYPPNGWGCSCRVFGARTIAGAKRLGGNPAVKLPDDWDKLDPKTAAPKGIGKGWAYAPGNSVEATINALAARTISWPYEIGKAYMAALPATVVSDFSRGLRNLPSLKDELRRYSRRVAGESDGAIRLYSTLGRLTGADVTQYGALLGADLAGFDYSISESAVRHVHKRHGQDSTELTRGQRAVTHADFTRLGELLNDPDLVEESDGRLRFEKSFGGERLIAIFEPRKKRRMLTLVTMWVRS